MHSIEDIQQKRRSMEKNFRLAAHYSELNNMEMVIHHAEKACQDIKDLKAERIEAASSATEVGNEA